MQNSLALVGAGRVGRALGRRLREQGWRIGAVVTRSEASARRAVRFIGASIPCAALTRKILASHLVLIAVPDDAVTQVARELARISGEELRGKTVLHTSGALDASALSTFSEKDRVVPTGGGRTDGGNDGLVRAAAPGRWIQTRG